MGVYNAGLLFLQATEPVHLHDTAGSPNPSKDHKKQRQLPKSNPEKYAKHEHMERHRSDEGAPLWWSCCAAGDIHAMLAANPQSPGLPTLQLYILPAHKNQGKYNRTP
jgi:hypothetical protein